MNTRTHQAEEREEASRRWPAVTFLAAGLSIAATLPAVSSEVPLERRARQGEAAAQLELGRRLEHGIGQRADVKAAVQWYRQAAAQGNPGAQYALGRLQAAGDGLPQDARLAAQWFYRAAEQGFAPAQNRLGRAHELGQGATRDLAEAWKWYALAAEAHPSARLNQDSLTSRLTSTQLAEAQLRVSTHLTSRMAGRP